MYVALPTAARVNMETERPSTDPRWRFINI